MRHTLLYLCFILSLNSYAQFLDTLTNQFKQKPGLDFDFETRNSLLLNSDVKFSGIKIGIRFGKKFSTGLSYNWLRSKTYNSINYFYNNINDTTFGYFKMGYWSIYATFVYHKTKRWAFSIPLQFGYGNSWLQKKQNFSFKNHMFERQMFVYEPTVAIQFKLLKWLALSTNLGYRFVWHHDKNLLNQLNGPIYVFNLNVLFDQLFFEAFPESQITKKFGPSEW